MKHSITTLLITTSLALLLPASSALAHGRHGSNIDQRLERQERRIEQGLRSGELTRREARQLRKKHQRISHLYEDSSQHGLSKPERRRLERKLNRLSDSIYSLKHNEIKRPLHRTYAPKAFGHSHFQGYQRHGRGDYIAFSDKGMRLMLRFDDR
ncbi:MAG: hypothetical protein H7842_05575 [Gammaproteobacteria bacterium SHHR-1]